MMRFKYALASSLALFLLSVGLVLAAGTAANTSIINVASATYNDSSGDPQTTFSNPVTTIVQQVYDLSITPNGSELAPGQVETALPGAPIYFNYIVTNTGNGDDTINLSTDVTSALDDFTLTGVTIYLDTGCDGSIGGDAVVSSVTLAADQSACIIVAGVIPASAADGEVGNLNLEGVSAGDASKTDTDNWAQAEANTNGNLTANKVSSLGTGTVAAGGTITYTVSGSNNGGAAAHGIAVSYVPSGGGAPVATTGIVISDVLDTDLSYNAASLSGTSGAGTVIPVYSDDAGTTWYADEADVPGAIDAVGLIIEGTAGFFPQSANYSMSFAVTVLSTATAGTAVNNTATVDYSSDGVDAVSTDTNTTSNTVSAAYDVAIGPEGQADTDGLAGAAAYTDPASGTTWNVTLSGGYTATDDTQTITDTVLTGDTVAFKHTIKNLGNSNDSFSVSASSAAGYSVTLYQADGVTPLLGNVGPLAPGATLDVVVKVAVTGSVGDTVTITATSANSGTATDITTDVIPTPVNRSVDLASNSDGVSGGQSGDSDPSDDDPANQTSTPGATLTYPLEITNTGNSADTFDLTSSVPAGWTVSISIDADCDGVADGAVVTDTGAMAPGATACFVAQVVIDAAATNDSDPGTTGFQPYDLSFTATSQTDPAVTDTINTQVTIQTAEIQFVTDQIATTSPDSVVTYTHTLINNGNAAASVDIPAQTGTAFIYQYSTDGVTWSSSLTAVAVSAGGTQTVYVRVIVPDTAVDGDSETVTIEAQIAGSTVGSVQDTTVVQAGELDLDKTAQTCADAACATVLDASGATAEPGNYLEYSIVATNIGSGNLTEVKVSDPLPTYTDFVSVSASTTVTGTVLYSTDGTTWSATAPVALATGGTMYVGVDTDADTDITDADVLAPAEAITITFVVQVQ